MGQNECTTTTFDLIVLASILITSPAAQAIRCRCNRNNDPETVRYGGCDIEKGVCELIETPQMRRDGLVPSCKRESYYDVHLSQRNETLECTTVRWQQTMEQSVFKSASAPARESFCQKACICRSSDLCNTNIEDTFMALTGAALAPDGPRLTPLKCKCVPNNFTQCPRQQECDALVPEPNEVNYVEVCSKNSYTVDGVRVNEQYGCNVASTSDRMETCITACFCRDTDYCNDRTISQISLAPQAHKNTLLFMLIFLSSVEASWNFIC